MEIQNELELDLQRWDVERQQGTTKVQSSVVDHVFCAEPLYTPLGKKMAKAPATWIRSRVLVGYEVALIPPRYL